MIRRIVIMIALLCVPAAAHPQQGDDLTGRIYLNALQYANGSGKPYRPDKAMRIMSALAKEGDPKAMNALAIMYATGKGTEIDYRAAMTWFVKATEAGYVRSFYNLSLMWKYALGVDQNYEEAYHMLKKGADAGEPSCQYGIGYMHYKGLGCSQDYGVAMNWFLKAAEEGNSAAAYMIGLCLRNGMALNGILRQQGNGFLIQTEQVMPELLLSWGQVSLKTVLTSPGGYQGSDIASQTLKNSGWWNTMY